MKIIVQLFGLILLFSIDLHASTPQQKTTELVSLESQKNSIKQINHIADVYPFLDKDVLIIFDIDDTLITTEEALGRHYGFSYILEKLKELHGQNPDEENKLYDCLGLLRDQLHNCPVEKETVPLFNHILSQKINVLGLTARSISARGIPNLGDKTFKHLEECQLFFPRTLFTKNEDKVQLANHSFFYKGMIFSGPVEKGDSLLAFLKHFDYWPKKIIFIDDNRHHVENVLQVCQEKGIEALCFFYTHVSELKENIEKNHQIAFIQLNHWIENGILLSDKEAEFYLE